MLKKFRADIDCFSFCTAIVTYGALQKCYKFDAFQKIGSGYNSVCTKRNTVWRKSCFRANFSVNPTTTSWSPVSLRLGHATALTAIQAVIHYRVAASLPLTREAHNIRDYNILKSLFALFSHVLSLEMFATLQAFPCQGRWRGEAVTDE